MSKVTAKFQVTIPPEVRKDLGIVAGVEVEIAKEGDRYVLITNPLQELKRKWRGKFKNKTSTEEYINEIRGAVF